MKCYYTCQPSKIPRPYKTRYLLVSGLFQSGSLTLGELFALAGGTQTVFLAFFLAWVALEQLSLL